MRRVAVTPANVHDGAAGWRRCCRASRERCSPTAPIDRLALRRGDPRQGRNAAHHPACIWRSRPALNAGPGRLERADPPVRRPDREDLRHLEAQLRPAPRPLPRPGPRLAAGAADPHRLQSQARHGLVAPGGGTKPPGNSPGEAPEPPGGPRTDLRTSNSAPLRPNEAKVFRAPSAHRSLYRTYRAATTCAGASVGLARSGREADRLKALDDDQVALRRTLGVGERRLVFGRSVQASAASREGNSASTLRARSLPSSWT